MPKRLLALHLTDSERDVLLAALELYQHAHTCWDESEAFGATDEHADAASDLRARVSTLRRFA